VAPIEQICKRFQLVARRLQKRYANRGTLVTGDEYDVQDLLATVLAADFDDVRDEEFTSSVARQNSRIDFVLVGPGIEVETKMTRENLTDRKLADELLVDIRRYEAHPSARHQFATCGWIVGSPVGVNHIQKALDALRKRDLVWRSARGEYARRVRFFMLLVDHSADVYNRSIACDPNICRVLS
jgi:hypothetical protein